MTEQEHGDRVQAWLDEAKDEPTAFGKSVIRVAERRGLKRPEHSDLVLDLDAVHEWALFDHLDGIDNREYATLPTAVAHAMGLDPKDTLEDCAEEDREDLTLMARGWTFGELWDPDRPFPNAG